MLLSVILTLITECSWPSILLIKRKSALVAHLPAEMRGLYPGEKMASEPRFL